MRLTFGDVRRSRLPVSCGISPANGPALAALLNEAQERLIKSGGDTGWWGTWAKMVFSVNPDDPYIVAPMEVARLINIDACRTPIRIQNEFYEFLEFGIGLQKNIPSNDTCTSINCCQFEETYDRGTIALPISITPGNKIRVYATNSADADGLHRVFINGTDTSDAKIITLDAGVQVNGVFLTLTNPFADTVYTFNSIVGVQKDVTLGPIQIYQVDGAGNQSLLATLGPQERSPTYRKYFLNGLPAGCCECDSVPNRVEVTAMAKLEYVPVVTDTDYLIIQSLPALKEECQSVNYGEQDSTGAEAKSERHHKAAIKLLQQELIHYMGRERPAVHFAPFGNARLANKRIGTLI